MKFIFYGFVDHKEAEAKSARLLSFNISTINSAK